MSERTLQGIGISPKRPLSKHEGTEEYAIYKKLKQEIAGARQRARDALLSRIQAKHDREQSMREIQRQLSGIKLVEAEKPLKCSKVVPAPQKRLIESLLALLRRHSRRRWLDGRKPLTQWLLILSSKKVIRAVFHKTNVLPRMMLLEPTHEDGSIQDTKMLETDSIRLAVAIKSVMKDRRSIRD
jgi:uncharacterized protein DUF3435